MRQSLSFARLVTLAKARRREVIRTAPPTIAMDQSISIHLLGWIVFAIAPFRPIALAFCQSNICIFSFFAPLRLRVRQAYPCLINKGNLTSTVTGTQAEPTA